MNFDSAKTYIDGAQMLFNRSKMDIVVDKMSEVEIKMDIDGKEMSVDRREMDCGEKNMRREGWESDRC